VPVSNGRFVALPCAAFRLLETPSHGVEAAADMGRMVPDTTFQVHDDGDARSGPYWAAKAIGFGTPGQERGPTGQLVGRQAARDTGRGAVLEGRWAWLAGPFHPLADRRLADAHRRGDLALGPAALQEFPGLETSGFFPVVR
jgi:hypothetical protein